MLLNGGATFKGAVTLIGAKVGGNLDLTNGNFHQDFEASGAVIDGELRLGSSRSIGPRWEPNAELILLSTSVGALEDRLDRLPDGMFKDYWPAGPHLRLSGLTFRRLGGVGADKYSEMTTRPASWYVGWLGRDAVFSPQPYRQLASVFREAGADETADSILYALRNRERNVAWEQGDYLGWLELSALKWVIGYGIGGRYFRALFWAVGFTVLGTWVLWSGSEEAQIMKGPGWCIWASLDEILPIVQLDKAHEEFINQRLDGWCRSYFYVHRIVAYVLGSFVVAGLAGLTQGL